MSANSDEVYADSSFLFSLVSKDSQTATATAYMARAAVPLFFTQLHRMELRDGLRNATHRGEITEYDRRIAFRQIDHDLEEAIFVHHFIEWKNVFRRADELSEKHAGQQGQRTIDLLHVAIALECGAKTFLSFDRRQRKLAQAAGLKVKP